jgi:riboflavin synthase
VFTGIVETVGRVSSLRHRPEGAARLVVTAPAVMDGLGLGDSIAVNGACLTVVVLDGDGFEVDLAPETLRRTNLGSVEPGAGINLERALSALGRLGGHIVQGHVDDKVRVASICPEGDCVTMGFRATKKLMSYVVEKGFIAIDGVSLTVVKRSASTFSVSVIPYTLENTILGERRTGDIANMEVDILAKYVESLLRK